MQVFLLEEPIYSKICFPGKAETVKPNFSVSWRSAMVGSWLGGTWNEKWGVSFLEDWLDSCLDQWGKKRHFCLDQSREKEISFSWLPDGFCGPSSISDQVGAHTSESTSQTSITTLLKMFFNETERLLLCHLRSGLRDTAEEGWIQSSFFLLVLCILISTAFSPTPFAGMKICFQAKIFCWCKPGNL